MAGKRTTSADTPADHKTDKMFPTITGVVEPGSSAQPLALADDFEKWMAGRKFWTWYRKSRGTTTTSKGREAGGNAGRQKLPESPVSQMSAQRRQYLDSYAPPPLPLSSSNSSFLSNTSANTDTTPAISVSTSPASSFSETFSPPTPPDSSSLLSPILPSTVTTTPILPPTNPQSLFSTEYFEVRRSKKGGYGAFAVKDIEKETVVMIESPLFRATFMTVFFELEKLTREQRREYKTLHGWNGLSSSKELAIYKTNRFETSGSKGGIFIKSSRFNHACHPFATCSYRYDEVADLLVFTACNPIKKDEEITISYTTNPSQLMDNYGFYCDCPQCPHPKVAKKQAKMLRGPY